MKPILPLICLILTGCASTDAELFQRVMNISDVRREVFTCTMPEIKTTYRDVYLTGAKRIELKPEHRYSDDHRLHEFMHYVSRECLTPDEREELLARYAPYYILTH